MERLRELILQNYTLFLNLVNCMMKSWFVLSRAQFLASVTSECRVFLLFPLSATVTTVALLLCL